MYDRAKNKSYIIATRFVDDVSQKRWIRFLLISHHCGKHRQGCAARTRTSVWRQWRASLRKSLQTDPRVDTSVRIVWVALRVPLCAVPWTACWRPLQVAARQRQLQDRSGRRAAASASACRNYL